ncbi:ERV/ALR sulfhydryl oxidase domain-containing protein [Xylogone sp. PMI_703]|nr:ERV/ALR sulfhydryl oxidase domain-containing protein [Xylogone sp. PMI_703]
MARRQHNALFMVIAVFIIICLFYILPSHDGADTTGLSGLDTKPIHLDDGILQGEATAPKLENATLKAELGNAAWKLLHTMMAKFPDKPSEDDKVALNSYIRLFARLYPCGDCARHFQKILTKYPPQVSSRSAAAGWACYVHNEVNKRLKKEIFDCSKIGDFYDCGCADDDEGGKSSKKDEENFTPLELDKEGLTRGG